MVTYDKSFKAIQTKTQPIQNQQDSQNHVFCKFFVYRHIVAIKNGELKLENKNI